MEKSSEKGGTAMFDNRFRITEMRVSPENKVHNKINTHDPCSYTRELQSHSRAAVVQCDRVSLEMSMNMTVMGMFSYSQSGENVLFVIQCSLRFDGNNDVQQTHMYFRHREPV